jgi:hypothetical protein
MVIVIVIISTVTWAQWVGRDESMVTRGAPVSNGQIGKQNCVNYVMVIMTKLNGVHKLTSIWEDCVGTCFCYLI